MKYLPADALVRLNVALDAGDKADPKGGYRPFSKDERQLIFCSAEVCE